MSSNNDALLLPHKYKIKHSVKFCQVTMFLITSTQILNQTFSEAVSSNFDNLLMQNQSLGEAMSSNHGVLLLQH